jgi:ribokinase
MEPRIDVVVFGQLARDLVLVVDAVPEAGGSGYVRERREMLGGKGANQAVALAQLGMSPALVAVAGDDEMGTCLLAQAERDGINVSAVTRRRGADTALMVDIVDRDGRWRYLENIPSDVELRESDVAAAAGLLTGVAWASVQLQQPPESALAAVTAAREAGCGVLLDGTPADGRLRDELLAAADVVRADEREAGLLARTDIADADDAAKAAAEILARGPRLVALAVQDGNYFAWRDGELMLPLAETPVADTTGAGDALAAALITGLARGYDEEGAARLAVAAAGATVGHPGGRPWLTPKTLAAARLAAVSPRPRDGKRPPRWGR